MHLQHNLSQASGLIVSFEWLYAWLTYGIA